MGEITEIANAVVAVATTAFGVKLLDTVSNVVGKIYEPYHEKAMADARNAIKKKDAEAGKEVELFQIHANAEAQALAIRCSERLFKMEMRRQKNISPRQLCSSHHKVLLVPQFTANCRHLMCVLCLPG